jgi:hypothetical protein
LADDTTFSVRLVNFHSNLRVRSSIP